MHGLSQQAQAEKVTGSIIDSRESIDLNLERDDSIITLFFCAFIGCGRMATAEMRSELHSGEAAEFERQRAARMTLASCRLPNETLDEFRYAKAEDRRPIVDVALTDFLSHAFGQIF